MPQSLLDQALGILIPLGVVIWMIFLFYARKPEVFHAIGRFFKKIWEYVTEGGKEAKEYTTELTFK